MAVKQQEALMISVRKSAERGYAD
ncbi:MAG: hypothetical protein JWP52_1662, partial [Rhizobacter sp.]|nr:hypothetical protein [Rhizobacter sp.]